MPEERRPTELPKRKYFVVTSLGEGAVKIKYEPLNNQFERTTRKDEAEFIIFDLSFPTENCEENIKSHLESGNERVYFFQKHVPIVFVDFEQKRDGNLISNMENRYKCKFPIYCDGEELLKALTWFERVLPYYNYKNLKNEDYIREVARFLIADIKTCSTNPF